MCNIFNAGYNYTGGQKQRFYGNLSVPFIVAVRVRGQGQGYVGFRSSAVVLLNNPV